MNSLRSQGATAKKSPPRTKYVMNPPKPAITTRVMFMHNPHGYFFAGKYFFSIDPTTT